MIKLFGSFLLALFAISPTFAEEYPSKPLTLIVPLAPGGVADLVGRIISQPLQQALGKPVLIDNRPGAGGGIGASAVARSDPDGHTLLLALSPVIALPEMDRLNGQKPSYELSDLVPIARLTADPFVVLVRPDSPYKRFADVVEAARAKPNSISFASSGTRGSIHFAIALVERAANVSFLHVPYRGGGPAVSALLTKDVDFTLAAPSVALEFVRSGQLRPIARSGGGTLPNYPGLSSFKEQGIDADYLLWSALYAPAATPASVLDKLRTTLRDIFADDTFQKNAAKSGLDLSMLQGKELAIFHDQEVKMANDIVHRLGKL
jgi:tripartite-type tricarboxylate transporter receptor subunit TctC